MLDLLTINFRKTIDRKFKQLLLFMPLAIPLFINFRMTETEISGKIDDDLIVLVKIPGNVHRQSVRKRNENNIGIAKHFPKVKFFDDKVIGLAQCGHNVSSPNPFFRSSG